MISIPASVEHIWTTPAPEQAIELAGRTAYQTSDKITPDSAPAFIRMILLKGHESVIEHASASLRFICDRGISHEIVRHRLVSYTQESTRYCNYSKERFGNEIKVIMPPGMVDDQIALWEAAMRHAELTYMTLIHKKVPAQIARSVLPTCLKTELVMTCNFREWRHFFKLRCAATAHPQMQEVAKMALMLLLEKAPTVFEDLGHFICRPIQPVPKVVSDANPLNIGHFIHEQ